jgi:hypothetical protein
MCVEVGVAVTALAAVVTTRLTRVAATEYESVMVAPPVLERWAIGGRAALASGTVRFGQQTKTSGCQPRGTLPNLGCTPGSIITQATTTRICVSGYT